MYNSNFIVANPSSPTTITNITDLASMIVSCWSPGGTNGRTMSSIYSSGSGTLYYFPSHNYVNILNGQIITINNQTGGNITVTVDSGITVVNGSTVTSGGQFTLSGTAIYSYVAASSNRFIRFANVSY